MRVASRLSFLTALVAMVATAQVLPDQRAATQRRELRSLRAAVEDLAASFGSRYPDGQSFLREIDAMETRLASADGAHDNRVLEDFRELRRRALIANPLVSGRPILFVERNQYPSDHHNTGTIFQTGEINVESFRSMPGGSLRTIDLSTGKVRTLVHSRDGTPRDPEVGFDGKRIVFSMRESIDDDYHIYTVDSNGEEVTRLTSARGVSDIDPFWLADGDIAFSSTREPKYCTCNRHIMANLFRMRPDGANILQIGKSIEFEGQGVQLPDGRLLYFRWEYVDRNFGGAQGLWVANPDGTNHALFYGQSTPHPILNARPIPGSDRLVCIVSSCHDRPWGALAILDRSRGVEGGASIARIWPESARTRIADAGTDYGGSGGFDNFKSVALKYEDPFALSEKHFLVSRVIATGSEKTGIFLVDTFGHELLLHSSESGRGCFDPMPVAPHARPQSLPARRDYEDGDGTFYLVNAYEGTHMKGVKPGSIRYLRVVENPPKLFWTRGSWKGQGQEAPAMNWHDFDNKRILGTVPVEEDGSAYFSVPSDRFVYFQLLDEKGRMVQSMRSGATVQSGEVSACVGCHDRRDSPPLPIRSESMALMRSPSRLNGWYGEARDFSFMREVQPVFTKHCVRCHDHGKEAEESVNLSSDRTLVFNFAYMELHRKGLIEAIGGGPNRILEASSWGSSVSPLVEVIEKGHHEVQLSAEELDRIVTWIDLNAPYYPTYASAHDSGVAGRAPLDDKELAKLEALTGREIHTRHGARPMISFDRPESSPILAGLEQRRPRAHREAVRIIRSGRERLERRPRADMPGFVPGETDRGRKSKYDRLATRQARVREAIRTGAKVYDSDLDGSPPAAAEAGAGGARGSRALRVK